MENIKLGVIGAGAMGMLHADNVFAGNVSGMALHALSDPSEGQREAARARYPGVGIHKTEEELFETGVDAVLLASPHSLHGPQAIAALSRGIHVLTEKPAGTRASEVARAVEIAKEKRLVYSVMFNQRATAACRKIRALLKQGAIGNVRRVLMIITNCYRPQSYFDSGAWRATWRFEGGGMLVNQCAHSIDQLTWWMGMPSRVNAQIGYGKWHDIEVDDDLSIHFSYASGASAHFVASTGDVPGASLLEIQGDLGKITPNKEGTGLTIHRLEMPEPEFSRTFAGGLGSPGVRVEECPVEKTDQSHLLILQNFSKSIGDGTPPIASAEDALKSLRVTQAVYLSSWLSRDVSLPVSDALFDTELDKRVAASKPRVAKPVKLDFTAQWNKRPQ